MRAQQALLGLASGGSAGRCGFGRSCSFRFQRHRGSAPQPNGSAENRQQGTSNHLRGLCFFRRTGWLPLFLHDLGRPTSATRIGAATAVLSEVSTAYDFQGIYTYEILRDNLATPARKQLPVARTLCHLTPGVIRFTMASVSPGALFRVARRRPSRQKHPPERPRDHRSSSMVHPMSARPHTASSLELSRAPRALGMVDGGVFGAIRRHPD